MKFILIIVLFVFVVALGCDRHESTYGTERPFTVENTGGDCVMPDQIDYTELVDIPYIPDPFLAMDATRISRISDWRCRRAEISELVQYYELVPKPPAPETDPGISSHSQQFCFSWSQLVNWKLNQNQFVRPLT